MKSIKVKKTKLFRIVEKIAILGFIAVKPNAHISYAIIRVKNKAKFFERIKVREVQIKVNKKQQAEDTIRWYWVGWHNVWVYDKVILTDTITDGYNTYSAQCTHCKDYSMQVMTVGKVQCSNCN